MNIERYRESVNRAVSWLSGIQNRDGTMNPVEKGPLTYYKVPRGFQIAGCNKEALGLLDWAQREILSENGDFTAERLEFHFFHYTYSSCWFVWAAQLMSRFDISYPGMAYLLKFRNPATGGYCSESVFSKGKHNEQDLLTIAFTSFVGLHMGLIDEAIEAAGLIARILENQPDTAVKLWLRVDGEGNLITEVPERCTERRFYVLEIKAPAQYYYYPGAVMVFLAKLYAITGNRRHLELADSVFDVCLKCHDDVFLTDGTGKVGLGSAYLYTATGHKKYAEAAMRSCDFLVNDQHPEGFWERGGKPTASSTAEFVVWLSEVASILH